MQTLSTKNKIITGISIAPELFEKLEIARKFEPRSHYISRILNANLQDTKNCPHSVKIPYARSFA